MPTAVAKGYRLTAATGIHRCDRAYQQDQVEILAHPRVPGCAFAVLADGKGGKSGGRKAADQVLLTSHQIYDRYVPAEEDAGELLRQNFKVLLILKVFLLLLVWQYYQKLMT